MNVALISLAQTSLRDPQSAAQQIMGWGLTRDVLWTALALVAVLNTFVVLLVLQASEPAFPLPSYFERPLALYVLIAGMMAIYVHGMYWAGLAMGGEGTLDDMLALVIWFQVLRAVAQLAIVVLSVLLPALGLLLSLVVAVWGLWVFLNFVAAALHMTSVGRAFVVLVLAAIGLVFGLGILTALIGLVAQGVS